MKRRKRAKTFRRISFCPNIVKHGMERKGTVLDFEKNTKEKLASKKREKKGKCSIVYDLGSNYVTIHFFVCSCF